MNSFFFKKSYVVELIEVANAICLLLRKQCLPVATLLDEVQNFL